MIRNVCYCIKKKVKLLEAFNTSYFQIKNVKKIPFHQKRMYHVSYTFLYY